ncbi:cupin domain-containing protein [Azospirillum soli]|uniref:cupin domain-containing protein n=1 Tax=Azospirillum soli TaxID=1304799 RepID=UPI001AE180C8|nr:cupin domain-containing protein [Azospirillum soli]MBP2314297.1 mannose-6-phosphate isomerase-like protein (cupin superfamily) [Azospirillum soli]
MTTTTSVATIIPATRPDIDGLSLAELVRRGADARFTNEYNCKLRRLFPWPDNVNTKRPVSEFGVIWVVLDPGTVVDAHAHDEEETFIVVDGCAELTLNGETTVIGKGDVAYIPRFLTHQLRNPSADTPFVMIDVYWDDQRRPVPPA